MAKLVRLPMRGVTWVEEDGHVGVRINVHWTAWVSYFVWGPLLGAAGYYLLKFVLPFAWYVSVPAFLIVLPLLLKFIVLGALERIQRFVLITQANVYNSQREEWFYHVINSVPISEAGKFESHIAGKWYTIPGALGIRAFTYTTEGDVPEVSLPASNVTQDDIDHIHALTALST